MQRHTYAGPERHMLSLIPWKGHVGAAELRRQIVKTCSLRSKSHYRLDGGSDHRPIALDLNDVNLIFLLVWD